MISLNPNYQPTYAQTSESDFKKDLSRRGYCPDHPSVKVRSYTGNKPFFGEKVYTPCPFCFEIFQTQVKRVSEQTEDKRKIEELVKQLEKERKQREELEDELFKLQQSQEEELVKLENKQKLEEDRRKQLDKMVLQTVQTSAREKLGRVKVLFIGFPGIGKSCIIMRYHAQAFYEPGFTVCAEFISKNNINLQDKMIDCQMWDTCGAVWSDADNEGHLRGVDSVNSICFRDASVIFICGEYSQTFEKNGYEKLIRIFEQNKSTEKITIPVLVGTKYDLPESSRKLEENKVRELAMKFGTEFIPVSARDDYNIDHLFLYGLSRALEVGNFTPQCEIDKRTKLKNSAPPPPLHPPLPRKACC